MSLIDDSVSSSLSRSTARRPFHYPVNRQFIGHPVQGDDNLDDSATYNRQRYYSRLAANPNDPSEAALLRVPNHVVPYHFLIPQLPFKQASSSDGKQGSFLTVFAIWNMLMGTTLLCLPWALHQVHSFPASWETTNRSVMF